MAMTSCFIKLAEGQSVSEEQGLCYLVFCSSLIKLGEGGGVSGLGNRQHCPKTERLAKDIGTKKRCRCNEVMLQARGDLEKGIRNVREDRVRPRQDGLSKWGESFCFSVSGQ